MNVLFYHSGEYKKNYTPDDLTEEIWGVFVALDSDFDNMFKCIIDFGYPQKMLIRIDDSQGIPYCTIHINNEEYEKLKYLCEHYVTFEKEGLILGGE
jgi:hypothetical protein